MGETIEMGKMYRSKTIEGIIIQDGNEKGKNLKVIQTLFDNLHTLKISIKPEYVRAIRFRKIAEKDDMSAQFLFSIRTIVLNQDDFDSNNKYDLSTLIHEYTHAIMDVESDMEKLFLDAYHTCVQRVYEATGDKRLSKKDNYHILKQDHWSGKRKIIDTSSHDHILKELGYEAIGTYGLKSFKEFICNLMGHYFVYGKKGINPELLPLCKQVEKYYK